MDCVYDAQNISSQNIKSKQMSRRVTLLKITALAEAEHSVGERAMKDIVARLVSEGKIKALREKDVPNDIKEFCEKYNLVKRYRQRTETYAELVANQYPQDAAPAIIAMASIAGRPFTINRNGETFDVVLTPVWHRVKPKETV